MFSDSTNPFEDSAFEVAPEDITPPAAEPWPPSEEHWPARPDLATRVLARRDSHEVLSKFGGR